MILRRLHVHKGRTEKLVALQTLQVSKYCICKMFEICYDIINAHYCRIFFSGVKISEYKIESTWK